MERALRLWSHKWREERRDGCDGAAALADRPLTTTHCRRRNRTESHRCEPFGSSWRNPGRNRNLTDVTHPLAHSENDDGICLFNQADATN
uniref:DUF1534 domain-containing protein n=1 Tax=Angiostrongylus cantonensis TaxID=6313 RepID=A0A0K0CTB5_ANGCA